MTIRFITALGALSVILSATSCTSSPQIETDGQVSLQVDKRWEIQRDSPEKLRFGRRPGIWGISIDKLAFNSHKECLTQDRIEKSEEAFIEPLQKRGAAISSFTLQTGAGTASCVSAIYHPDSANKRTEFLICYLPEVNALYAGDSLYENEAKKMIQSLHDQRACTPSTK